MKNINRIALSCLPLASLLLAGTAHAEPTLYLA